MLLTKSVSMTKEHIEVELQLKGLSITDAANKYAAANMSHTRFVYDCWWLLSKSIRDIVLLQSNIQFVGGYADVNDSAIHSMLNKAVMTCKDYDYFLAKYN